MLRETSFYHQEPVNEAAYLASLFREMAESKEDPATVFEELENDLNQMGYGRGSSYDVVEILHNPNMYCRSESFTKVMELLLDKKDIKVDNKNDQANMCYADGGAGFRTAMLEGFSGKDVGAATKIVITFSGDHLISHDPINRDSSLWETKPETARTSLRGKGTITFDDVHMVSFRFPIKFFPEEFLSEEERDLFEEGRVSFVVRHFIAEKNKKNHERALAS